jgi:hypothetical protein
LSSTLEGNECDDKYGVPELREDEASVATADVLKVTRLGSHGLPLDMRGENADPIDRGVFEGRGMKPRNRRVSAVKACKKIKYVLLIL